MANPPPPPTTTTTTSSRATTHSAAKRRKLNSDDHHHSLLLGLPNHVAHISLSLISPTTLFSVCRSWRHFIYSSSFPPFRSLYTLSLPTTTTAAAGGRNNQTLKLSSFDPISSKWITIDSPPVLPPSLHRHPSFISRNLPVQSVSVSGHLLLLAATSDHLLPAFPNPLIFNPLTATWTSGPPLSTPRRWCAAGASRGTVVVASGIGSHYTQEVSRSVEKWVFRKNESFDKKIQDLDGKWKKIQVLDNKIKDLDGKCEKMQTLDKKIKDFDWKWEKMRSLKNGKLCREAIDAVGFKGKLLMVNVKGDYAKEGFVYDVDSDEWVAMPTGMLGGWRGPAAAMDEEWLFVVDESRGVLKRYDESGDEWSEIVVDERLKGAEHIAAGGGRVCVLCENDVGILVVDVVATPPRLWVLETPAGSQILGLHILPRMCRPEF